MLNSILVVVLLLIKMGVVAFVSHEGGHFLASVLFGKPITKWHWSKDDPFRVTWNYPSGLSKFQKCMIAKAGFGTEIFVGMFMEPIYCAVVVLHLFLYNRTNLANDFKYFHY